MATTETRAQSGQKCPNCGAEADPGQLVCLDCGGRLELDYRRPAGGKRAAAVVLVVLALAGAAFALTLSSVDDEAEEEISATPASKREANPGRTTEESAARTTERSETNENSSAEERARARRERAADRRRAARRRAEQRRADRRRAAAGGGVPGWPRGRDGFMVVLLSTQDRGGAVSFARTRRRAGVDGVLRADDYPSLSSSEGFYIVFAGPYPSRRGAERAANRLQGRFSGVFVQFVNGSERK